MENRLPPVLSYFGSESNIALKKIFSLIILLTIMYYNIVELKQRRSIDIHLHAFLAYCSLRFLSHDIEFFRRSTRDTRSLWALFLPYALSVYYLLIMMRFFKGIPSSLFDSAKLVGSSEFYIVFKIVSPLEIPIGGYFLRDIEAGRGNRKGYDRVL